MKPKHTFIFSFLALLAFVSPSYSQMYMIPMPQSLCAPTVEVQEALLKGYGEKIVKKEGDLVLYKNVETGTWTILEIKDDGETACYVDDGQDAPATKS
jgi:hypothetical protein